MAIIATRDPRKAGTNGADNLQGTNLYDAIYGLGGDDHIEGLAGGDLIDGGAGYDTAVYTNSNAAVNIDLTRSVQSGGHAEGDQLVSIEGVIGSQYDDIIIGDAGANRLEGGRGVDRISGGGGNDVLFGGIDGAVDILDGGSGVDLVDYSAVSGSMTIVLGEGTTFGSATINSTVMHGTFPGGIPYTFIVPAIQEDALINIENVIGTNGSDHITGNSADNKINGGAGNDVILGGAGNDVIIGGAGADVINGGIGNDTVSYETSLSGPGVRINLNQRVQSGGDAEGDELISIENVIGSWMDDVIVGNGAANKLFGGYGNDFIDGGGGNDIIQSGPGFDTLVGGSGADTFVFASVFDSGFSMRDLGWTRILIDHGQDTILDFQSGIDKIDLTAIDANSNLPGDQAFRFVNAFTGAGGEAILSGSTFRADIDGDLIVDVLFTVAGATQADFLL